MCMQCVAQGAPMVGVAVTMLNRRNIKTWVATTWQKAHGQAPPAANDEPGPEAAPGLPSVGAADGAPEATTTPPLVLDRVPTGV
jgi:hypothetical protein